MGPRYIPGHIREKLNGRLLRKQHELNIGNQKNLSSSSLPAHWNVSVLSDSGIASLNIQLSIEPSRSGVEFKIP